MSEAKLEHMLTHVSVDEVTGCWLWTAARNRGGYGRTGKSNTAHRIMWQLVYCHVLRLDQLVCHTCDVRHCVNPKHLFVGSASDNMVDMYSKNRHPKTHAVGSKNSNTRLKESDVIDIRSRRCSGATTRELAETYGLQENAIQRIVSGKNWSHVPGALRERVSK